MITRFRPADYEILVSWWKHWDWPQLPVEALPEFGVVVHNPNGIPLAMGFLYSTDSSIAWLEWITANPLMNRTERADAIEEVIFQLTDRARRTGFKFIFSTMNPEKTPGLIKKMKKFGFLESEVGMTNLMARI